MPSSTAQRNCEQVRGEEQLAAAVATIREIWPGRPLAGVVLGTGMGPLADEIDAEVVIDYRDIPHFGRSTALAHQGCLVCGHLANVPVMAMQGRLHLYEGYSVHQVTLPVRVMRALGAQRLILTNASGGLNPLYRSGDIVVVDDHINLMFRIPLAGQHHEAPIAATPHPYCPRLIGEALAIARRENFTAHRGVYVAMTGPNYETRAEYRWLRALGGDCVGMSTVPEVLAAVAVGMRVLALSIVTNVARPDAREVVDAEEVLHDATLAQADVRRIVHGVLGTLSAIR